MIVPISQTLSHFPDQLLPCLVFPKKLCVPVPLMILASQVVYVYEKFT
jgi:hypothetical protein